MVSDGKRQPSVASGELTLIIHYGKTCVKLNAFDSSVLLAEPRAFKGFLGTIWGHS